MVIAGIIQESISHFQGEQGRLVARLISLPAGSLRKKKIREKEYWYLRRHAPDRGYEDVYLGAVGDAPAESLAESVRERKTRLKELKTVKDSLRALGVSKMELRETGFDETFLKLAHTFGEAGLWGQALTLIGSWCFNVYVQCLGVDFYPLRTVDFDFALRIPPGGAKAHVDTLLKDLGFTPQVDFALDQVTYVLPGVGMVEVFMEREGPSAEEVKKAREDLAVSPARLAHLHILLDHPVRVAVRGVHKAITVPSMPAFFVHRLVTAKFGEYRQRDLTGAKVRKDYKQAALVAKRILGDEALSRELAGLIRDLPPELSEMMSAGARAAAEYMQGQDLTAEDVAYIQRAAGPEPVVPA